MYLILIYWSRAFIGTERLLSCTLLGTLQLHRLSRAAVDAEANGIVEMVDGWPKEVRGIAKVNGIAITPAEDGKTKIVVGGVGKNGKGVVEIFLYDA